MGCEEMLAKSICVCIHWFPLYAAGVGWRSTQHPWQLVGLGGRIDLALYQYERDKLKALLEDW
jgi:hypothetical protein